MTLVTASGYAAEVSAAAVTMLATCAAFQTATSTSTVAGAKAFIAEDDAGTETPTNCLGTTLVATGVWAAVRVEAVRHVLRAWRTYGHEGEVILHLHVPTTAGDDAGSIIRRARNLQGTIVTQLEALFGAAGSLVDGWPEGGAITLDDESGAMRGFCTCPITIHWSDLP
jgi:hypothetical protein